MRLLSVTDLLPKSESSIDRAGLLADELGAELTVLHVVSPVESERALEQSLQIAIARMKSRVRSPMWRAEATADVVVRPGNPARVILEAVEREQPDLLIMGPHEKRGVVDALQGTIAEKVVSARSCPVLVVQQDARAAYRNVLLALDVAAGSRAAVRVAERFVVRDGAQATAIHACSTDLVTQGNPLPTILRAIDKRQPDLLVIGTRGDGRMRRAVLGSVANQLLRAAPCDILIVPRGAGEVSHGYLGPLRRAQLPSRASSGTMDEPGSRHWGTRSVHGEPHPHSHRRH